MRANLDTTRGAIVSERIALSLAPLLGRLAAQEKVAAASRLAAERGGSLREALLADSAVAAALDPAALESALEPSHYLGAAGELVDRVLARHRELRGRR